MPSDSETLLDKIDIESSLAAIPIAKLNLSVRPKNALLRANITTALEVSRLIETNSLTSVPNVGVLAAQEIEERLGLLLKAITLDTSGNLSPQFNDVEVDEIVEIKLPDNYLNDSQIDILVDKLGEDVVRRLKMAGIEKFGELAYISRIVSEFMVDAISSLDTLLRHQKRVLQTKLERGQLHPHAQYFGKSIDAWLGIAPETPDQKFNLLHLLTEANGTTSLEDELLSLTSGVSDRDLVIFTKYFDGASTLEQTGEQMGITRERVRQITSRATTKLWSRVNRKPGLYLQSAILISQDLDDQLSIEIWEQQLQERGLIDSKPFRQEIVAFDFLCCLLRSSAKRKDPPNIIVGEELIKVLNSPSSLSLGLIKNMEAIPRAAKREIQRRISFVGGIHLSEASELLNVTPQEAVDILNQLGFMEVTLDWFTIASRDLPTNKWPILKAGLAMMEACGPLEFGIFCDGLRRYIARFYDVLAPPVVIRSHLTTFGFELEDGLVCWTETPTGYLAESDKCFIEVVKNFGLIVTFQEVLESFQANGFSITSATSRVLPQSPIVEKVELGLYKMRGQSHTWEDIQYARSRQETIDYQPEVIYGTDGIIRYRISIGSWALNGVISISTGQQPLPDLGGGWNILVDNENCGKAKRDDYLIWGLGRAFNALSVQIGDRVELAFDAWEEPCIRIRKI